MHNKSYKPGINFKPLKWNCGFAIHSDFLIPCTELGTRNNSKTINLN